MSIVAVVVWTVSDVFRAWRNRQHQKLETSSIATEPPEQAVPKDQTVQNNLDLETGAEKITEIEVSTSVNAQVHVLALSITPDRVSDESTDDAVAAAYWKQRAGHRMCSPTHKLKPVQMPTIDEEPERVSISPICFCISTA